MVDGEARRLVQAHDAQRRGDRAPPRREQGPSHQHQNVAPDRGGEVTANGRIHAASTSGTLAGMAHAFL